MVDTQDSTISYYHERRKELLEKISGESPPECKPCGKEYERPEYPLEVHHVNPEKGHESGIGGWDHYYKLLDDLQNGVSLELRCKDCHKDVHREDGNYWEKVEE